jgi:hypothetical protein
LSAVVDVECGEFAGVGDEVDLGDAFVDHRDGGDADDGADGADDDADGSSPSWP